MIIEAVPVSESLRVLFCTTLNRISRYTYYKKKWNVLSTFVLTAVYNSKRSSV